MFNRKEKFCYLLPPVRMESFTDLQKKFHIKTLHCINFKDFDFSWTIVKKKQTMIMTRSWKNNSVDVVMSTVNSTVLPGFLLKLAC